MRVSFGSRLFVFGALVASFGASDGRALAQDVTGLSLWSRTDQDTRIAYPNLVALLNRMLANAQQVNIYNGVCHSGGLLAAGGNLTMPYFIGVGERNASNCTNFGYSSKDRKSSRQVDDIADWQGRRLLL